MALYDIETWENSIVSIPIVCIIQLYVSYIFRLFSKRQVEPSTQNYRCVFSDRDCSCRNDLD